MKTMFVTFMATLLASVEGNALKTAFWSFNSGTSLSPVEGAGTLVDAIGAGTLNYVQDVSYGTTLLGAPFTFKRELGVGFPVHAVL